MRRGTISLEKSCLHNSRPMMKTKPRGQHDCYCYCCCLSGHAISVSEQAEENLNEC